MCFSIVYCVSRLRLFWPCVIFLVDVLLLLLLLVVVVVVMVVVIIVVVIVAIVSFVVIVIGRLRLQAVA